MRSVNLHLDRSTVLEVKWLRGDIVPTRARQPVTFDDVTSFLVRIGSAEVAVSARTLSDLLNRRVFAYPGAPLKNISIRVSQDKIVEKGSFHKGFDFPFRIEGSLEVSAAGEVRMHSEKIDAAHIPMKSLLRLLGEDLSKLAKPKPDTGVRIEGNDIVLNPGSLFPPPHVEGKLFKLRMEQDRIVLRFGAATETELSPPLKAESYVYYQGGVLRFGKLTMTDSDLELVNIPPHSPFDFSLPDYNRQLVAGYSKNTRTHGLIVFMPDLNAIKSE